MHTVLPSASATSGWSADIRSRTRPTADSSGFVSPGSVLRGTKDVATQRNRVPWTVPPHVCLDCVQCVTRNRFIDVLHHELLETRFLRGEREQLGKRSAVSREQPAHGIAEALSDCRIIALSVLLVCRVQLAPTRHRRRRFLRLPRHVARTSRRIMRPSASKGTKHCETCSEPLHN